MYQVEEIRARQHIYGLYSLGRNNRGNVFRKILKRKPIIDKNME